MTIDVFGAKLKEYWPKMNIGQLKEISSRIQWFSDEQRETLYNHIISNHNYAPSLAKLNQDIHALGIKQKRYDVIAYAYECLDCGVIYAGRDEWIEAHCCPSCLSRRNTVIKSPEKSKIRTVQVMCLIGYSSYNGMPEPPREASICPIMTGQNKAYGPTCDQFYIGNISDCYSCSCSLCCSNARKEREELRRGIKGSGSVSDVLKIAKKGR